VRRVSYFHLALDRQQTAEKRTILAQRQSQILGGNVLAFVPLPLEVIPFLCEHLRQPLHRSRNQCIRLLDSFARLIDECDLYSVPPFASLRAKSGPASLSIAGAVAAPVAPAVPLVATTSLLLVSATVGGRSVLADGGCTSLRILATCQFQQSVCSCTAPQLAVYSAISLVAFN
jgi:hypothetical protein